MIALYNDGKYIEAEESLGKMTSQYQDSKYVKKANEELNNIKELAQKQKKRKRDTRSRKREGTSRS